MSATKTKPHGLNATQARNVRKWIKALLSGRYKQGTGQLQCLDGSNCCLGVGARVTRTPFRKPSSCSCGDFLLPARGVERLGLRDDDAPLRRKFRGCTALTELNDTRNATFEEIANLVERNLKTNENGLFVKAGAK